MKLAGHPPLHHRACAQAVAAISAQIFGARGRRRTGSGKRLVHEAVSEAAEFTAAG
jgi:hypothetical protein